MRALFTSLLILAGCAVAHAQAPAAERLLPTTIGVVVANAPGGPVVAKVSEEISEVRAGDVVVSLNGVAVSSAREFNRLVSESRAGTTARLELRRDGTLRRVELPVRQLDVIPRS